MIEEFDGHKPSVDPTAFVHETAVIIGRVTIGKNASIWPYCVLRGDVADIVIGSFLQGRIVAFANDLIEMLARLLKVIRTVGPYPHVVQDKIFGRKEAFPRLFKTLLIQPLLLYGFDCLSYYVGIPILLIDPAGEKDDSRYDQIGPK